MMQSIPHIKQDDLLRWEKILNSVAPKILDAIDSGLVQEGRLLALHVRNSLNAGALAYVSGDVPGCLVCYKEAVERFQWFFEPKFSEQVDRQYIYEASEEVLCSALIIRSPNIYSLAKRILPFTVGQGDARVQFINALVALLAGDLVNAEIMAKSLIETPAVAIGTFLPSAVLAIAHRDMNDFLAAINEATNEFDRHASSDARGTPEAAIFNRGAALIRLYEIVNNAVVPRQGMDIRLLPSVDEGK